MRGPQFNYDYQPLLQDPLSTIESGLATNDVVDVKAGDMVYDVSGKPVKLEKGIKVFDADGQRGRVRRLQPAEDEAARRHLQAQDFTWSDGTEGLGGGHEAGLQEDCDKESGATSFIICDAILKTEFGTGLEATVT